MTALFVQVLTVCALAIGAWFITERFSPDDLLTKLIKLGIFIALFAWFVLKVLPRVL